MYGEVDDERGERALRHAIDIVIATKFGFAMPDEAERHAFPVTYEFGRARSTPSPSTSADAPRPACGGWAPT